MKRSQFWLGIGASVCMGILILDGRTALAGAREGIDLCIRSLIPSLFPFFVLSGLITGTFGGISLPLLRPVGTFLKIPAGCESLLIPAFLGGYPAGAQAIGQMVQNESVSEETARRLLLFCNNPGPSFLFGVLGSVFPSGRPLWALWGIQITASIICARLIPASECAGTMSYQRKLSFSEIVASAVRIMGSVCGWVVLFRILLAFLDRWFLWMCPVPFRVAITGLLELSNGCFSLPEIGDPRLRFLLCSGILSFGGLCVTMQTASVVPLISMVPYLGAKVMQSLLCICISAAFQYRKPALLLFVVLFYCLIKKGVTRPGYMVYNDSINQRRKTHAVSKKNRPRLYVLSAQHPAGRGTDSLHEKRTAQSR